MNDIYTNDPIAKKQANGNKRLKIFLSSGLVIALILAILGAAVVLFSFDNQTRYFSASPISIALAVLSAVTVAFAISSFFVFKSVKLEQSNTCIGASLCARLLSIVPVAICAYYVISVFNSSTDEKDGKDPTVTLAILFLMFVFCAVYELSCVIKLNKTLTVISGITRIIFCLYIASSLYFDMHVELNSPFKLVIQFAAAALAIDTCMQVRNTVSGVSTSAYIAAKALSISIGALAFTITVCAIIQDAAIRDIGYLWYSIYFISSAVCSCIDLVRVKYPTSPMLEPESEPDETSNQQNT